MDENDFIFYVLHKSQGKFRIRNFFYWASGNDFQTLHQHLILVCGNLHKIDVPVFRGMHWIRIAFPMEHPAQMEYVPYQRMIHTSAIRLLPVGSKGNGICHLLLVLLITYLQCIKKTGGRRGLFLHGNRKSRSFVTIRTDRKRHCGKGFHPLIRDCDLFRCCRVIRNLYSMPNQRWFCFITFSAETDAGSLVDFSLFVMEKGFRYHSCIKECQWAAIPVPFLKR